MSDATKSFRKLMAAEINSVMSERQQLECVYGKVWDTEEVTEEFEILGFLAPFVSAKRKSTGKTGTLVFQHQPRFYFDWREQD